MEFFVTESQKFILAKHLHAAARSKENSHIMAVFTGYTEQNSSQIPGVCLGGNGQTCRQSIG